MRVKSSYIVVVAALIVVALSGCCTGTTATIPTLKTWGSEHDWTSVCIMNVACIEVLEEYYVYELKAFGPEVALLLAGFGDYDIIRIVRIDDGSGSPTVVYDGPPYPLSPYPISPPGTVGATYVYDDYWGRYIILVTSYQPAGGLFSTPMPASEPGAMTNT